MVCFEGSIDKAISKCLFFEGNFRVQLPYCAVSADSPKYEHFNMLTKLHEMRFNHRV